MTATPPTAELLRQMKVRGNRWNWNREADVEIYDGTIRIQQPGSPVDVILLTRHQWRQIDRAIALAERAASGDEHE